MRGGFFVQTTVRTKNPSRTLLQVGRELGARLTWRKKVSFLRCKYSAVFANGSARVVFHLEASNFYDDAKTNRDAPHKQHTKQKTVQLSNLLFHHPCESLLLCVRSECLKVHGQALWLYKRASYSTPEITSLRQSVLSFPFGWGTSKSVPSQWLHSLLAQETVSKVNFRKKRRHVIGPVACSQPSHTDAPPTHTSFFYKVHTYDSPPQPLVQVPRNACL